MPDNTVPQSINNDPITSISPSGVSSIKGLGGSEWIPDQARDDGEKRAPLDPSPGLGMTESEVAPPLFETETTPLVVEKLPSEEISPSAERKQQVIEEAQKPDAQITNKPPEDSSHIVNKATGNEVTHPLRTSDRLTTIADDNEAEFIKEVEQHAHAH